MSLRTLLLATFLVFPFAVQAGEMPKEGTESFTNTWLITSSSTVKAADQSCVTYEINGIARGDSGAGLLNNTGFRATGVVVMAGKHRRDLGAATYTDKDGDEIFATYTGETEGNPGGKITLAAGTGKYAGISGTGEWTEFTAAPIKADDKFYRGIVFNKVHWVLK